MHLVAVGKMLNLFAATGHFSYVKGARLYLQWMLELPLKHPWLYKKFSKHGFHSIRRSDRYWAGLSTDLIIGQVMRSIKTRGGLTRGHGFTHAVRLMWVYAMHSCAQVHDVMTSLTGLAHRASACRKRDFDMAVIINWASQQNPFDPNGFCLAAKRLPTMVLLIAKLLWQGRRFL